LKIAHITPTRLLGLLLDSEETYHLILADRVRSDPAYRDFYAKRSIRDGDFVILDNDAYEAGTSCDFRFLAETIHQIQPAEVALADCMGDTEAECLKRAAACAEYLFTHLTGRQPKFMGIPHAKDFSSYLHCVEEMMKIPGVGCIGIGKFAPTQFGFKPSFIAREVWDRVQSQNPACEIHVLGMDDELELLKDPWAWDHIRGTDSAKLVRWGLLGLVATIATTPPPVRRGKDYFDEVPNSFVSVAAKGNIRYWREMCKSKVTV